MRAAAGRGTLPAAIGAFEPVSVNTLAQRANLTKGQASRSAQALVERGPVSKESSDEDGRGVVLTLTARGRPLYRKAIAVIAGLNAELFGCLDAAEQASWAACWTGWWRTPALAAKTGTAPGNEMRMGPPSRAPQAARKAYPFLRGCRKAPASGMVGPDHPTRPCATPVRHGRPCRPPSSLFRPAIRPKPRDSGPAASAASVRTHR